MDKSAHESRRLGRMKHLFRCVAALAVVLLSAGLALAEMTPEYTVKEFVGRIKKEGNPWPIVDYIDWEKAFVDFPAPQKEQLKLKSADEMKNFFREMLQQPAKKMKEQMDARIKEMPKDMQDRSKPMMTQLEEMMKKKEAEMKDRISKTEYEVVDSTVEGETATVKLKQKYNTEEKTEEIKLQKKGDRWLLPSIKMAQMGPNATQQAAPPGGAPGGAPQQGAPAGQ